MIELIQKYVTQSSAVKMAGQLEAMVRSGALPAEALLPPVREVARALGVSPGTAAAAYKELRGRGVVATDGRRGTRVLARPATREYTDAPLPRGVADLRVANPDPALLPQLSQAFGAFDSRSGPYGGEHRDARLHGWAVRSFEEDGVSAEHLLVTPGAIPSIYRGLRACLAPGAKVAVEDPGFNEHHACVRGHAMTPVPVSVDDEGALPKSLHAALRAGASGVILTTRWQSPLGASLTAKRAAAIREVLGAFPSAAVLVDDYSCLLAGGGSFHNCLDANRGRWLMVRSLNKAVAPDLRLAVSAGDGETMERLRREQWLSDGWVSGYLQRVAAEILMDRSLGTLLAKARATYSQRREALLEALQSRGIRAHGATGLNVWIPVLDEGAVLQGMLGKGYGVRAGARYRLSSAPAVRITTAQLLPRDAQRVAASLESVLGSSQGGSP